MNATLSAMVIVPIWMDHIIAGARQEAMATPCMVAASVQSQVRNIAATSFIFTIEMKANEE